MTRRRDAVAATWALGAALVMAATAAAACDDGARAVFSCAARGERFIQLCAADGAAAGRDYLEYRFGRFVEGAGRGADPPEFVFPAQRRRSLAKFFGATYTSDGRYVQSIRFATHDAQYTVFTESHSPSRLRAGVRVQAFSPPRTSVILCDERPRFHIEELRGRVACDPATPVGRACID